MQRTRQIEREHKQLVDDQIVIGMKVMILEAQHSAPFNGAIGTVMEIGEVDHAPIYSIGLYGGRYSFRAYDLRSAEAS